MLEFRFDHNALGITTKWCLSPRMGRQRLAVGDQREPTEKACKILLEPGTGDTASVTIWSFHFLDWANASAAAVAADWAVAAAAADAGSDAQFKRTSVDVRVAVTFTGLGPE